MLNCSRNSASWITVNQNHTMNKQKIQLVITVRGVQMVLVYEGAKCISVNPVEPVETIEFSEKVAFAKRYLFNEGFAYFG